jgi:hypothetical protein
MTDTTCQHCLFYRPDYARRMKCGHVFASQAYAYPPPDYGCGHWEYKLLGKPVEKYTGHKFICPYCGALSLDNEMCHKCGRVHFEKCECGYKFKSFGLTGVCKKDSPVTDGFACPVCYDPHGDGALHLDSVEKCSVCGYEEPDHCPECGRWHGVFRLVVADGVEGVRLVDVTSESRTKELASPEPPPVTSGPCRGLCVSCFHWAYNGGLRFGKAGCLLNKGRETPYYGGCDRWDRRGIMLRGAKAVIFDVQANTMALQLAEHFSMLLGVKLPAMANPGEWLVIDGDGGFKVYRDLDYNPQYDEHRGYGVVVKPLMSFSAEEAKEGDVKRRCDTCRHWNEAELDWRGVCGLTMRKDQDDDQAWPVLQTGPMYCCNKWEGRR